jgi:hypothetical protein
MDSTAILQELEVRFRLGESVPVKEEYVSLVAGTMRRRGIALSEQKRKDGKVFFVAETEGTTKKKTAGRK